jgi:nitrogen fixation/metabolism regulation signal transduction histidine kinase
MVFKNFRLVCTVRTVVLAATLALSLYLIMQTRLYATAAISIAAVIYQIGTLIHYVDKSNRDLSRFLLSVKHTDFTSTFPDDGKEGSHRELRETFDSVLKELRQTRGEREEQYRYLQTVVQHIGIGLIAFDLSGHIDLVNSAAKRLLGVTSLRNINDLDRLSQGLSARLHGLTSGQRQLYKIELPGEILQVSIAATEFKLGQRAIKLVSFQNIASELAEREMEAWQQLVRVLTHEIMNSITPISSLASTSRQMLENGQVSGESGPEDLLNAVTTIEKRSQGLLHFVDAYRSLTRVPRPRFKIVRASDLLERIAQLAGSRPDASNVVITVDCQPPTLELTADPDLVEQVLINLTANAVQALDGQAGGEVQLLSRLSERGRVLILVRDNGPGISPEALESIFVPFYTTKKDGTGIGLSLSRQIMRLHKGEISVSSVPGEGAAFTLRF